MEFSSAGGMRSPFSPRVRQSIPGRRPTGLGSAKKNQSKSMQSADSETGDVIYKSPLTTVSTYGSPLPVMVTETLTFASCEVSGRLSSCGWGWAVCGRRVLAWELGGACHWELGGACHSLTLPQTDLAHRAALVVLFLGAGAQMPSCIGVSPEGTVRYWPSIGQEGAYSDVSAELAGQECELLTEPTEAGLVLATTTCTVVLLQPTIKEGRAEVSCRTLRPPSGWLGGLGRRVSLLFFGAAPHQDGGRLVGAAVLAGEGGEPTVALVGGGGAGLQLWRGSEHTEHQLRRPLAEHLQRAAPASPGDPGSLEVIALDVRARGPHGLLLFFAIANMARSPELRYAIAHISVEDLNNPRVTSLVALRGLARSDADDLPRFLPLGPSALIYSSRYIAFLSMTVSNDKIDLIDVASEGDRILCAELCQGRPLLFSRKHGVLALTTSGSRALAPTPSLCDSPMGSPCPSDMYDGNLSLYEIDPHEVSMVTTDACGKLKTAFLFHLRRDTASCRAIIDELFPPPPAVPLSPTRRDREREEEERDVDSVLDRTVLKIAKEMLDDIPAGDPRWKPRPGGPMTSVALGSSSALQVLAQLLDKQRAFTLFIEFLHATHLWRRLGLLTTEAGSGGSSCIGSQQALGCLQEQLCIAITLRKLQQGPAKQIIDHTIHQVVSGGPSDEEGEAEQAALASGALSPSDLFYRRVASASRLLPVLARPSAPSQDQRLAAKHALDTIQVLTSVVSEVVRCRSGWPCPPLPPALGPRQLLPALEQLVTRAYRDYCSCPDTGLRAQLYSAASALADLMLSWAAPLASLPHTQPLYDRMRANAIRAPMEAGQTECAAALAEKYRAFELLVEMCVRADDWDRLYSYIDKYANEGMAETAFAWLADQSGSHSAQLIRRLGARYPARLAAWLASVEQRAPLLALHHISAREYGNAAVDFARLAAEETESVGRMATMASLAKLCLLSSEEDEPSDLRRRVEDRLSLAEQHAALPRDLRIHHGLDAEDTRVMAPEDLVQMYIDSESQSLTEYDYKKALDLTDYIADMERRDDLRLKIWCACVRRDCWSGGSDGLDDPRQELTNKMFFKLVDLVHLMGGDLEILLPPVEDILTAPSLADLVSDPRFHYLLKYGYECVDTGNAQAVE